MEPSEDEKAKAQRTVRLLYLVMILGVSLPLLFFFLHGCETSTPGISR
ncbi:MAG: hypothetical protein KBA71_00415 [Opitutaceae bacterium]|nr:hypothetical protein [Opitutaceae bacterium]